MNIKNFYKSITEKLNKKKIDKKLLTAVYVVPRKIWGCWVDFKKISKETRNMIVFAEKVLLSRDVIYDTTQMEVMSKRMDMGQGPVRITLINKVQS